MPVIVCAYLRCGKLCVTNLAQASLPCRTPAKSLGVFLSESDATTRQLMKALGHDDIEHDELYSREASQVRLAVAGMDKVVKLAANRRG